MNALQRILGNGSQAGAAAPAPDAGIARLQRQREELAERVARLQLDLGGLTYEMAIRDHFRLDVLVRVAARLQDAESELGEVERLLKMEQNGASGTCPSCSALHGRSAVYCWRCGSQLMDHTFTTS
jgi:hypothetical protein